VRGEAEALRLRRRLQDDAVDLGGGQGGRLRGAGDSGQSEERRAEEESGQDAALRDEGLPEVAGEGRLYAGAPSWSSARGALMVYDSRP